MDVRVGAGEQARKPLTCEGARINGTSSRDATDLCSRTRQKPAVGKHRLVFKNRRHVGLEFPLVWSIKARAIEPTISSPTSFTSLHLILQLL